MGLFDRKKTKGPVSIPTNEWLDIISNHTKRIGVDFSTNQLKENGLMIGINFMEAETLHGTECSYVKPKLTGGVRYDLLLITMEEPITTCISLLIRVSPNGMGITQRYFDSKLFRDKQKYGALKNDNFGGSLEWDYRADAFIDASLFDEIILSSMSTAQIIERQFYGESKQ